MLIHKWDLFHSFIRLFSWWSWWQSTSVFPMEIKATCGYSVIAAKTYFSKCAGSLIRSVPSWIDFSNSASKITRTELHRLPLSSPCLESTVPWCSSLSSSAGDDGQRLKAYFFPKKKHADPIGLSFNVEPRKPQLTLIHNFSVYLLYLLTLTIYSCCQSWWHFGQRSFCPCLLQKTVWVKWYFCTKSL